MRYLLNQADDAPEEQAEPEAEELGLLSDEVEPEPGDEAPLDEAPDDSEAEPLQEEAPEAGEVFETTLPEPLSLGTADDLVEAEAVEVETPPASPKPPVQERRAEPPPPRRRATGAARQAQLPLGLEPVVEKTPRRSASESREELIQRLLDPHLSLQETAKLLNVCPTTVRRYTNRGLLAHYRTPGNQRRFRLSDVLAFMERQGIPAHGLERKRAGLADGMGLGEPVDDEL